MAAPLRRTALTFSTGNFINALKTNNKLSHHASRINQTICRTFSHNGYSSLFSNFGQKLKVGVCVVLTSSVFATGLKTRKSYAAAETTSVSRKVDGVMDMGKQKFTLYQFQSCPYCCKVRAALDFFGFPYEVVEVHSVTKKQIKFSEYKKVPVLVVDGEEDGEEFTLQFYDSSLIVSALGSYVYNQTPLQKLHTYYPFYKEKEGRKTVWDFPNKYFIMYDEISTDTRSGKDKSKERKWRKWTDDILMHTISPNVYRTPSESLEAFKHFSDWGEWEKNFSNFSRLSIVYIGAFVMYFVGRIVKRKYSIKDDPRDSLYDACDEWMRAVGRNKFLGVDKPNLADLAVYGALHSFSGCQAFNDLMAFHKVKAWYQRMDEQINKHQGALIQKEK